MLRLKSKDIKISTGGPLIVILNRLDAEELDLQPLDRLKIKHGRKSVVTAIDISESNNGIKKGQIGLFKEVIKELGIKKQTTLGVLSTTIPHSIEIIRKKLDEKELTKKEIEIIIKDLIDGELTEIELTYFVSACYKKDLSFKETAYLIEAITKHGDKIDFNRKIIADKHCIGGVPNNRTTMLVVPIVTAAGVPMIKTSSRSITSPAGTADTMEVLSNVTFPIEKIVKIIKKINGCIVWGGAIDLAAADEKLIKVRHPLRLDPKGIMLASILSKKLAVNSTHILIDIPIGKTAKITTKKEAMSLKKSFERLGRKIKIKIKVIITDGSQPIGNGIGPNLEAKDILYILRKDPRAPKDLEEKAVHMSDLIFKMTKTKASAREILDSGKAYTQFMKIMEEQEGDPKIIPDSIALGKFEYTMKSSKTGKIKEIDNKVISRISRIAGAPHDKEAGIYLYKKLNQKVKRGEKVMTIYSDSKTKLKYAKSLARKSILIA
ncbi:thymidine phosphorylase [Candidatus Woesearchaeota archaeon]|jgi:AMP phosphorylase|nr:thymidine phosphorylase [Candidatus Woesearchaeota archaeon]MBT4322077.1 thymidine phosphorylase [Candidatus Woesearchaeota archaeon]MBT4630654.1 thymidine phosphorylase [Candidatus Woesearchaeota archaeon]